MKRGLLIILSGPSGVGKGTVTQKIVNDPELNIYFSISMTTRKPRNGEIDGVNYFFVTPEQFEDAYQNNRLLESASFVGNRYGTPADKVEEQRNNGKNVLLEIEINGATQVMSKVPDAVTIFLVPPSLEVLENRIRGRHTETDEVIRERLEKARKELTLKDRYKYVVVNDIIEKTTAEVKDIILKNMSL